MTNKTITKLLTGTMMREGGGVKLFRYIGADHENPYNPILLFDYFDTSNPLDYIAGFPFHPHRGFETITYMLEGRMAHEDNKGHKGVIGSGDVQWMTAGKGIIHTEMPQQGQGRFAGLQLWLNLPAAEKLCKPGYQEYAASELGKESHDGVRLTVIAGTTDSGTTSVIKGISTDPLFFDLSLQSKAEFSQTIPADHQSIIFVLQGEVWIKQEKVPALTMAVLGEGDRITLNTEDGEARCLLLSAKKIHEPIARLGPFVMNTQEEVLRALEDFRNNRF